MKQAVNVAITGAAGQIGYALAFRVASGQMLGPDQPVNLHLLEITPALGALNGVVMELNDCAFPTLNKIVATDDAKVAFRDLNVGLLVGARPRGPGMERKDLLVANAQIFSAQGKALNEVSPAEGERIMRWVFELSQHSPFQVKTTEAPSYRRIAIETMRTTGKHAPEMKANSVYHGFQIRDGHGIVFVSNLGEIYPSGFLPLRCGNVRVDSLVNVYRNSETFRGLHSPDQFHGKCGACEYSHICGGSRARAFAYTGDALGTDPFCPYEPTSAPLGS